MDKQSIFIQSGVGSVTQELDSLPGQIMAQSQVTYNLNRQRESAKLDLDMRQNEIFAVVSDMINPATGKPIYSNDASRQAETTRKCKDDEEYRELLQKYQTVEQQWNAECDRLKELENKFLSAQCRAKIVAAQLNFWAGEDERAMDFRKTA